MVVGAQAAAPALSGGHILMRWTGSNAGSGWFDEVIWAAGMADEETRIFGPADSLVYEGPKFWTTDRLQRLAGPGNFVVVSGGGDGALQDYLRVAFRRERFDHLINGLPIPPEALALVQSAEDRGARSAAWERSRPGGAIAATRRLAELAAAIERAATLSLADSRFVASLAYELRGRQASFALVHRAPHLSAIYPLNRFLVEVVRRHFETRHIDTVFPGEEIVDVERISGPGGSPTGSPLLHPSAALGAWHRVSFTNASGALPRDLDVNAIMVRHGPRAPSAPAPRPGVLGQPCQVLPYGV